MAPRALTPEIVARFYDGVAKNIEESGRSVLGVIGSHHYTIGNHLRALPELLLIGAFDPRAAVPVLNQLSAMMIERGRAFDEGEMVDLGGKYPACVIAAKDEAKTDYTIQAGRFFQHEDYAVAQVVFCDPKGRFPWDAACEPDYRVEVLRRLAS